MLRSIKNKTKNQASKFTCSSCGNEMMKDGKISSNSKNAGRYFFCPYCFTYSIVHTNKSDSNLRYDVE